MIKKKNTNIVFPKRNTPSNAVNDAAPKKVPSSKCAPATLSKEKSILPKSITVVGKTPGGGVKGCEAVISITADGCKQIHKLPVADLAAGNLKILSAIFADAGHYDLVEKAQLKLAAKEILKVCLTRKAILLDTSGLNNIEVDGKTYSAYVWGKKHYWLGDKPDARAVVSNYQLHAKSSGTTAEWKTNVGRKLRGNPYPIVIHTHALAAAIRRKFGFPSTCIALVGEQGVGKSTTQQSAQSIVGPIDGVISMSGTKIGIIEHLAEHPDSPVFYQDSRQIENRKALMDIIFDVADNTGRKVSGRKSQRITATMFLSNERLLAYMASGKNDSIDEGVYARIFEILCAAPYGAFHELHGCTTAADFADELSCNSEKYYGTVWPAWIRALSENWPDVLRLYEKWLPIVKEGIAKRAGDAVQGRLNNRILDALSFSAWAGWLASRLKILPVKRSEIVDAYGLVMKEYIDRQQSGSTPLTDQLVIAVRGCLDENPARFPSLASFSDASKQSNPYGYRWESKKNGTLYLFLPNVFDRHFIEKFGSNAYGILKQSGFLVATKGRGHQLQVRIPGTGEQKSFIAIREAIRFDKK